MAQVCMEVPETECELVGYTECDSDKTSMPARDDKVFLLILIIITRPKPAYGRQGLAGSWGQNTDEVSTFLVFLTSHFAPAALSLDLNQPGTIKIHLES